MLKRLFGYGAVAAAVAVGGLALHAQNLGGVLGPLATIDPFTLFSPDDPAFADPGVQDSATANPPHMPRGSVYKLFGSAANGMDPQNPFNEVISFDTRSVGAVAGAFRLLGDHVQVNMLTDQIELKYFFVGRTCGGGSPRIQLGISGDGDGNFNQVPGGPDQNAFGYLGDKPFGGACVPNTWIREDMTDAAPKWDLSQWSPASNAFCGNAMTCTWAQVVAFFQTIFPNHRVLNAVLVDDAGVGQGCAYFDLVNTGARTYTGHEDATGAGNSPNRCP